MKIMLKKAMHGMPIEVDEVFGSGETVRMLGPDMSIVAIGQLKNTDKGIVAKPRKVLVEAG